MQPVVLQRHANTVPCARPLCAPQPAVQLHAAPRWRQAGSARSIVVPRVARPGVNVSSVLDAPTRPDVEQDSSVEQFQWTKQWYPVAAVDFMDTTRPQPFTLMGRDLVLWTNKSGEWFAFEDKCPHRLAPLSEGRVEDDGTLLCAYHAWRFDGSGNCTAIPQSKKELEAKHSANPRACAVSYPTTVQQGLLWVWPDASPNAAFESAMRPPATTPELDDETLRDRINSPNWSSRELPYDWYFFFENVTDPAHVPVSHHGIVGNRYTDAKYYDMLSTKPLSTQDGYGFEISPPADEDIVRATQEFKPPGLMRIKTDRKDGSSLILVLYAVPTRPGFCRHIGRQVLIKGPNGEMPKGLGFFALPMPNWLLHITAPMFLHQDAVFLHLQGVNLAASGQRFLDAYYTPNPQDKGVITFRQWVERRAGGGVPWPAHVDPIPKALPRAQLFDTYHAHTEGCTACQGALKNITTAKFAVAVLAVVAVVQGAVTSAAAAGAAGVPAALPPASALAWGALGAGLAALSVALHKFSGLFYEYRYHHADNP